jgi:hypothetical protein
MMMLTKLLFSSYEDCAESSGALSNLSDEVKSPRTRFTKAEKIIIRLFFLIGT